MPQKCVGSAPPDPLAGFEEGRFTAGKKKEGKERGCERGEKGKGPWFAVAKN